MQTIVAQATPVGKGAIHIIRLSGTNVFEIINNITLNKVTKTEDRVEVNFIINKSKKIIDQVLLLKFYAPNSYTGEDLIEINCHGNQLIVQIIINELIKHGAQPAQKGEFTKRALLNEKIKLNEVENISFLFSSRSSNEIFSCAKELTGKNSKILQKLADDIFQIIANLEINIDYPPEIETDEKELKNKTINQIKNIKNLAVQIYEKSSSKKPSNFRVLFLGKPNVGKSSLINHLINEDKIIVSNIKGTTRDVIEVDHFYNDHLLTFVDSAGIRETEDFLEQESIKKTKEEIKKASIIFYLKVVEEFEIKDSDFEILLKDLNYSTIYTKSDLINFQNKKNISPKISVKNNDLKDFYVILDKHLKSDYFPSGIKSEYIISNLKQFIDNLDLAINNNDSIDLINEHLISARENICNTLSISENNLERINKIFDNFCIGK